MASSPDIHGIISHAKIKSENAIHKVEEALKKMIKQQKKINFNSVAEEAGVSKGFIYKHQESRARIQSLRHQQEGIHHPKQVKRNMNDASKDIIISALRSKIKELEKENMKMKELLKIHYGKMYESI